MPHSQSKPWADYREDCEKQPDEELAGRMENYGQSESKMRIARIVYENRQMQRQHEYNIEQIELQNQLNNKTVRKQMRVTIVCTVVQATATLLAALAATYLGYTLTQIEKPPQNQLKTEIIQPKWQSETQKVNDHLETESEKIASPSPQK